MCINNVLKILSIVRFFFKEANLNRIENVFFDGRLDINWAPFLPKAAVRPIVPFCPINVCMPLNMNDFWSIVTNDEYCAKEIV